MTSDLRLSGAPDIARAEADIRFNYNNLSQIIAASNSISSDVTEELQAQFYSTDGGTIWHQTSLPTIAGESHSDPCVDWTSDGTAWALTLGTPPGSQQIRARSFRSIDSGANWTFDSIVSGDQTAVDKPALWVDHSQASPFKDNLYALWGDSSGGSNVLFIARREGLAGAWHAPQQLSGPEVAEFWWECGWRARQEMIGQAGFSGSELAARGYTHPVSLYRHRRPGQDRFLLGVCAGLAADVRGGRQGRSRTAGGEPGAWRRP